MKRLCPVLAISLIKAIFTLFRSQVTLLEWLPHGPINLNVVESAQKLLKKGTCTFFVQHKRCGFAVTAFTEWHLKCNLFTLAWSTIMWIAVWLWVTQVWTMPLVLTQADTSILLIQNSHNQAYLAHLHNSGQTGLTGTLFKLQWITVFCTLSQLLAFLNNLVFLKKHKRNAQKRSLRHCSLSLICSPLINSAFKSQYKHI